MSKKLMGISIVSFLASIGGIIISNLLLKEDVTSTAHTLFEYFPSKFGVIPSSTWEGAIMLGLFISVLQIVSASVAFSRNFSNKNRIFAFVMFSISCAFDNWTDVVFRSGNLTGNIKVATTTTFMFYTVGSEVLQGFSWLIFFSLWRQAISEIMWGLAKLEAGIKSISAEMKNFRRAAARKESDERDIFETPTPSSPSSNYKTPLSTTPDLSKPKPLSENQNNYKPAYQANQPNSQMRRRNMETDFPQLFKKK